MACILCWLQTAVYFSTAVKFLLQNNARSRSLMNMAMQRLYDTWLSMNAIELGRICSVYFYSGWDEIDGAVSLKNPTTKGEESINKRQ